MTAGTIRHTSALLGDLSCHITSSAAPGSQPDLAVVMCHGFGASGNDLVPLGEELLRRRPGLMGRVRFVFPAGPLSLAGLGLGDMRAWWPIDVGRIQRLLARGALQELTAEDPEGLGPARRKLMRVVGQVQATTGLPTSRIVLAGFSQGAMLATDVALRLEERPAALGIFSGALICADAWRPKAVARTGLPVFQAHGRSDGVLPYQVGEWLRELLVTAGLQVDFRPFDDGHTISANGLEGFADLLEAALSA